MYLLFQSHLVGLETSISWHSLTFHMEFIVQCLLFWPHMHQEFHSIIWWHLYHDTISLCLGVVWGITESKNIPMPFSFWRSLISPLWSSLGGNRRPPQVELGTNSCVRLFMYVMIECLHGRMCQHVCMYTCLCVYMFICVCMHLQKPVSYVLLNSHHLILRNCISHWT